MEERHPPPRRTTALSSMPPRTGVGVSAVRSPVVAIPAIAAAAAASAVASPSSPAPGEGDAEDDRRAVSASSSSSRSVVSRSYSSFYPPSSGFGRAALLGGRELDQEEANLITGEISFEVEEMVWEESAEEVVRRLLQTVDHVLYTGQMDSGVAASAADAGEDATSLAPERFPHRKPVVSYLRECAEWSGAFTHMRVQGVQTGGYGVHSQRSRSRRPSHVAHDLAAMQISPLPLKGGKAAAAAASSTHTAAAASTPVQPLSLSGVPARLHQAAPLSSEPEEEIFASHGTLSETFAVDSDPLAPYSSLGHAPGRTDASLSVLRRSHGALGFPPLTPSRLKQYERDQAGIEAWWKQWGHPRMVRPLVQGVVQLIDRAYERQRAAAKNAAHASVPASPNKNATRQSEEEEEEVLFFDGDASMPNPYDKLSTAAAAASVDRPISPSTRKLYSLLHLSPTGHVLPRRLRSSAHPAGGGSTGDFVRFSLGGGNPSEMLGFGLAGGGAAGGEEAEETREGAVSPSVRAGVDTAELEAAAAFAAGEEDDPHATLLPADLDFGEDSMVDPLSYHSPSYHSRYSLTRSTSRATVGGGATSATAYGNPLSRSASRQRLHRSDPDSSSPTKRGGTAAAAALARLQQQEDDDLSPELTYEDSEDHLSSSTNNISAAASSSSAVLSPPRPATTAAVQTIARALPLPLQSSSLSRVVDPLGDSPLRPGRVVDPLEDSPLRAHPHASVLSRMVADPLGDSPMRPSSSGGVGRPATSSGGGMAMIVPMLLVRPSTSSIFSAAALHELSHQRTAVATPPRPSTSSILRAKHHFPSSTGGAGAGGEEHTVQTTMLSASPRMRPLGPPSGAHSRDGSIGNHSSGSSTHQPSPPGRSRSLANSTASGGAGTAARREYLSSADIRKKARNAVDSGAQTGMSIMRTTLPSVINKPQNSRATSASAAGNTSTATLAASIMRVSSVAHPAGPSNLSTASPALSRVPSASVLGSSAVRNHVHPSSTPTPDDAQRFLRASRRSSLGAASGTLSALHSRVGVRVQSGAYRDASMMAVPAGTGGGGAAATAQRPHSSSAALSSSARSRTTQSPAGIPSTISSTSTSASSAAAVARTYISPSGLGGINVTVTSPVPRMQQQHPHARPFKGAVRQTHVLPNGASRGGGGGNVSLHSSSSQSALHGGAAAHHSYSQAHSTYGSSTGSIAATSSSSSGASGFGSGSVKVAPRKIHVPASVTASGASRTASKVTQQQSTAPSTIAYTSLHHLPQQQQQHHQPQSSKAKATIRVPTTLKASTSPTAHGGGQFATFSVASAS